LAIVLFACSGAAVASQWGEYIGKVVAEWGGGGREMRLVQEFAYKDPKGKVWKAPTGSVIDGASIPRVAWPLIGGPFEGKYRDASVIHDVACVEKKEKWEDVHEVFYTAMLASGVDLLQAKVMYGAVYHFGPRWERKFKIAAVPAGEVSSRIRNFGAMSNQSSRVVAVTENRRMVGGGGGALASKGESPRREVVDISVREIPTSRTLTEQDFGRLRVEVEKGNLSLADIRSFKP
jgi:hypothetical protein